MAHLMTIKKKDGTEAQKLEFLATCDLVSRIVSALNDDAVESVSVKRLSDSESRDRQALAEIIQRLQTPEQVRQMEATFQALMQTKRTP
jgi:hypothetical protein